MCRTEPVYFIYSLLLPHTQTDTHVLTSVHERIFTNFQLSCTDEYIEVLAKIAATGFDCDDFRITKTERNEHMKALEEVG